MLVTVPLVLGGLMFCCIVLIVALREGTYSRSERFGLGYAASLTYLLLTDAIIEKFNLSNYSVLQLIGVALMAALVCLDAWTRWRARARTASEGGGRRSAIAPRWLATSPKIAESVPTRSSL